MDYSVQADFLITYDIYLHNDYLSPKCTFSNISRMPKTITENNLLNHYVQDTHILNSHNRLIAEEITRELKTKIVGSNVITLERTKGRGRSDHSWSCPKYKGLLFTLLLKHNMQPDHLCLLTGTMAVSITETI